MDGDMIGLNQKAKGKTNERLCRTAIFAFCLLPFDSVLAAELLPDPTRPPAEIGIAAEPNAGPVLQSVLIAPGRRSAVISGQLVAEGGRYGEAKLIKITEGEVVLANREGRQTLQLFPGVEKHASRLPQGQALERGKKKSKHNTEQKAP